MQSKPAVGISHDQDMVSIISARAKAIGLTEKQLIDGIMNGTTWWRVRNNKSAIAYNDVIKLLDRIGIQWKAFIPEQTVLSSDAIRTKV